MNYSDDCFRGRSRDLPAHLKSEHPSAVSTPPKAEEIAARILMETSCGPKREENIEKAIVEALESYANAVAEARYITGITEWANANAQAVTNARNESLEEAAKAAYPTGVGGDLRYHELSKIAAYRIRSLKRGNA